MSIRKWKDGRTWAVYDDSGALVVVALYRRGAEEVSRRLSLDPSAQSAPKSEAHETPQPYRAAATARSPRQRF